MKFEEVGIKLESKEDVEKVKNNGILNLAKSYMINGIKKRDTDEIECPRCGEEAMLEDEYPKHDYIYCEHCNTFFEDSEVIE